MSTDAKPTPGRRPCDQCTRRKVRCNHASPCDRCIDSGLDCTHTIVRKKRGPRKGRGAVLDTLRASETPGSSPHATSLQLTPATSGQQLTPQSPETTYSNPYIPTHDPLPVGVSLEPLQQNPFAFDDSLTFDEFAQHVLADTSYFVDPSGSNIQQLPPPSGATLDNVDALISGAQAPVVPNVTFLDEAGEFQVTPMVEHGVDLFFAHIYPIYPLLTKETVIGWLQNPIILSRSEKTLIWSMCATTLAIVNSWPSLGYEQRAVTAREFVRRCKNLRVEWDYMEDPCPEDILTSLFIANTYFDLKQRKSSWVHVREAISLAISAGFHHDASYADLDEETKVRRRRTFALLYITERGASIQDGFPVSILLPPPLPKVTLPGEDPTLAHGLSSLHDLFSLLDFKFVKLWNEPGNNVFASSGYSDLALLQNHLRDLRIEQSGLSDVQLADVLVTQQWLRLIFWQAALRQGYISTTAEDAAFSYSYPIEVAMELCQVVKSLPPVAIQAHGLGIFEKQFEIAYSLMDALMLSGTSHPEHHDCLRYLLLSLSASPSSRQLYVRTLESKISSQQKYRRLNGVELLRDDRGSQQNSRRSSRVWPARIQGS